MLSLMLHLVLNANSLKYKRKKKLRCQIDCTLKKKRSRCLLTFLFKILFLLVRGIIVVEQEDNACCYASVLQGHETGPDSQTSTSSSWSRIMSLSKTANPTNFTVCNTKIITLWQQFFFIYCLFSISETFCFFWHSQTGEMFRLLVRTSAELGASIWSHRVKMMGFNFLTSKAQAVWLTDEG